MCGAMTAEPPCECIPSNCYLDCCERHICRWQREQIDYWTRFTCPFCGAISHNLNDADQRYCARCHVFVDVVIERRDRHGACRGHATR
jgi:hypothetical protein